MQFLKNQDGATAIEYGLIAALVAVIAIIAMTPRASTDEPLPLAVEASAQEAPEDINPPG